MAPKLKLKEIKILIADNDYNLGILLTNVLQRMGFKYVHYVQDTDGVKAALKRERKDILITEWQMKTGDGIELTKEIRRSPDAPIQFLPIIMLTARAERQDVEVARDAGVTEFVVKPFNSLTIYRRIQQVIDNPRGFMLVQQYIGPDRRRKEVEAIKQDRRLEMPEIVSNMALVGAPEKKPKLLLPDYAIKKRIGLTDTLDTIITPQLLAEAQQVIDDLKDEALGWIKHYVQEIEQCYTQLVKQPDMGLVEKFKGLLLDIKGNTGTFGYVTASQLAQRLYQFVRFDFAMKETKHYEVMLKYLQSMKLLLGSQAGGKILEKEQQLLAELSAMMTRFQKKSPLGSEA